MRERLDELFVFRVARFRFQQILSWVGDIRQSSRTQVSRARETSRWRQDVGVWRQFTEVVFHARSDADIAATRLPDIGPFELGKF